MTILALDTTSQIASLALRVAGRTVAEVTLESTTGFAHLIFAALDELRNKANFSLNQVDCFAAASGPGSFTGVRVGLSAVKGLAESMGKRVFGVSNLLALATQAGPAISFGKHDLRAVSLDARRSHLYVAVYDSELSLVMPEAVLPAAEWLALLDPAARYEFVALPGSPLPAALAGTPFAGMPYQEVSPALAGAVARCAERAGAEAWLDPSELDANYVRRSDAELFWRD